MGEPARVGTSRAIDRAAARPDWTGGGEQATNGASRVPVDSLKLGTALRIGAEKPAHVALLAELGGAWPPILITANRTIIDGRHRYLAARELRLSHIACEIFEGTDEEAFLEALRRNITHGLPLNLRERKRAATTLLRRHPDWSDRRIAQICALSHHSVGGLRSNISTDEGEMVTMRRGRDDRLRPTKPSEARQHIAAALQESPQASLREIARLTGSSAETVRSVKGSIDSSKTLTPARFGVSKAQLTCPNDSHPVLRPTIDAAVASAVGGKEFALWFEQTAQTAKWINFVDAVPLSRIYEIADAARGCSRDWSDFAAALVARVNGQKH